MDELIKKIHEIIKDYRREDLGFLYKQEITEEHIKKWINQFEEDDREFILSELLHILPESYLSKENTIEVFTKEFEILSKDFGYKTIPDFLDETVFLDCQEDLKSQKILLDFVDDILKNKYNYSIGKCGKKEIKNWIYIDDVLASGRTFKDDIIEEINKFGIEEFKKSNIRIISSFFILHSWGMKNVRFSIDSKLKIELKDRLKFYGVSVIDNNPYIHHWWNSSPKFNHVYPKENENGKEFLEFIENAFERGYDMTNEKFAFRSPDYPKKEEFYSSSENRDRYEEIILNKGIEIINSIDDLKAQSIRPLGLTSPGYKTLGTGSHFFTWRNISNTCPLVFWWGTNDWFPLFPVKNRGNR